MKRILFLWAVLSVCTVLWADEFGIVGSEAVGVASKIDTVFVVKNTDAARLQYTANRACTMRWYRYDLEGNRTFLQEEKQVSHSSVSLSELSSSGFQLQLAESEGDTISKYAWVFNYEQYPSHINGIQVNGEGEDRCDYIQLQLDADLDTMYYDAYPPARQHARVSRLLTLMYDSTYYDKENRAYLRDSVVRHIAPMEEYVIESPLDSTTYFLTGDQFALAFGDTSVVSSERWDAVAIALHATAQVLARDALNEKDRGEPSEPTEDVFELKGSAPLNVEVLSYCSPASFFYRWCMSDQKDFSNCIIHSSDKNFRYSFENQGTYYLRLQVSNDSPSEEAKYNCEKEQVYTIEVYESMLQVPNIFTPNGDGKNDEFRVAYKSIVKFHGWIYNVWGRKVYEWTDPATGWDGTINGSPAAAGAYMYVIEATGADKDANGRDVTYYYKGTVNLLR